MLLLAKNLPPSVFASFLALSLLAESAIARQCETGGVCCQVCGTPIDGPGAPENEFDQFGKSAAIDGDTLVIGEQGGDTIETQGSGLVHTFQFNASTQTWDADETFSTLPSDQQQGCAFGGATAVSGSLMVVGAKHYDDAFTNQGKAFVFQNVVGDWQYKATLEAPSNPEERGQNYEFGHAVAIDGDVIVVGSHRSSVDGNQAGRVYIYRMGLDATNWNLEASLSQGEGGDEFGWSVDIEENVVIVGAPHDVHEENPTSGSGVAYVFRYEGYGWSQAEVIPAPLGSTGDHFGKDVCIDGAIAVVTAHANDDYGLNAGCAWAFRYEQGSWSLEQQIGPCEPAREGDKFGWSADLVDDLLVVGAGLDHDGLSARVNVFRRLASGEWLRILMIADETLQYEAVFGWAVATNGDEVVVADPRYDGAYVDEGRFYSFTGFSGLGVCCPTDLDANGVVDIDDVEIMFFNWGNCTSCVGDVDGSGLIDGTDLGMLLDAWGPCDAPGTGVPPPPEDVVDCFEDYGSNANRLETCLELIFGG